MEIGKARRIFFRGVCTGIIAFEIKGSQEGPGTFVSRRAGNEEAGRGLRHRPFAGTLGGGPADLPGRRSRPRKKGALGAAPDALL